MLYARQCRDMTRQTYRLRIVLALAERGDHPWKSLTNEEILHTAGLYSKDRQTGETGFTLAAILLFGSDDLIADVCPAYRTEGILRQENLDRYDDRITLTRNLIDAYDELVAFAKRHTDDRFLLEGGRRVSARDIIIRELVGNLMIHREFMSPFPAQLVIERSRIYTRNASKALYEGTLSLSDFSPVPKNPTIAGIFRTIGRAEELGSGMRNLDKYSRLYSGKPARLTDGDVFYAEVPLTPVAASRGEHGVRDAIGVLANRDGSVSSEALAAYLGVSTRTAQRHLRHLLETGYVVPLEGMRQHRYVPRGGLDELLG